MNISALTAKSLSQLMATPNENIAAMSVTQKAE